MQATSTISPVRRSDTPVADRNLSTEEIAAALKVKPQTIRASLCKTGEYLGLRPTKLPNRRLLWEASEVDRLLAKDAA